jgi:GT2 family glycosyltransferase
MNQSISAQLSICVITYNRPDNIIALILSVLKQRNFQYCIYEFIILNNGSTVDYTPLETLIAQHPELKIKYIKSDKNLGVPGGRNVMMKQALAPYILIVDDDVEFSRPDDLLKLNVLFDDPYFKENNVAVIALNVHYYDTKAPQISAFPHKKYQKYKDKSRFLTGHFIGAANLNRRDAVAEVGYYGEGIFYGMEEYELSLKLIEKGYKIAYDSEVIILHKESPQGRLQANEKLAMMWHNKVFVFWRFLPLKYVFTTHLLWGLRYLKLSKFDWKGWVRNCKKIRAMKKKVVRMPISKAALEYLASVEARLWF